MPPVQRKHENDGVLAEWLGEYITIRHRQNFINIKILLIHLIFQGDSDDQNQA